MKKIIFFHEHVINKCLVSKTKLLLLLLTVFTMSTNAQTFDWSNATDIGTIVEQTVNGTQIQYSNSSNNTNAVHLVDGNGFRGSTGNIVTSQGIVTATATFTFNSPVNIQTIYSFDDSSHPQADWTFTPTGGSNSNVVATIPQYSANNVAVNWTNVTSFEVTSSTGNSSFAFDDIVFTPYTAPCTVNIPDANFKAALVGNTAINTNGDTEIQCSEASAFTGTINVNNLNISDLTGIEAFTNITGLRCEYNAITSLDVSNNPSLLDFRCQNNSLEVLNMASGNNTAITVFTARNNADLTCIQVDDAAYSTANWTNIDAGIASFSTNCNYPCTAITIPDSNFKAALVANTAINTNTDSEISCTEALAFTGILDVQNQAISDLTGIEAFTNITGLFCNNNALTTLDVSNNTSLIALRCLDNSLTSLNVANSNNANVVQFNALNNPNLPCIQIDAGFTPPSTWQKDTTASYSDNCNVAPCTVNIPDTNFKAYLVGNTAINTNGDTEIQCSEATAFTGQMYLYNESISDLTGIEAFVNITNLDCTLNTLTSIDLSNNIALEELYCHSNAITELDLSENTALRRLNCFNNGLTSLNIANGNNASFTGSSDFIATSNPNLTCIQIDAGFTPPSTWQKDTASSYSANCAALSVDSFTLNSVSIYPNPATSIINIEMKSNLKQVRVYSILGAEILKTTSKNINTSNLKHGVYFLQIEDEMGRITSKRFIKQ